MMQDGHGRESPIDSRVSGYGLEVKREHVARTLQRQRADGGPSPSMAPADPCVGHVVINSSEAARNQHELGGVEHQPHAPGQGTTAAARGPHKVRGDAQTRGDQQRPQRDGRPVDQQALPEGAWPAHAPDGVERAVDGEHQAECREEQHREAGPAQATRASGKLREITQHLARDVVRDQAFHQPLLQHVLELGKHRKRCEQRQRHGQQRYQGDGGGKRQAAGGETQAVLAEALAQRKGRGLPGEA